MTQPNPFHDYQQDVPFYVPERDCPTTGLELAADTYANTAIGQHRHRECMEWVAKEMGLSLSQTYRMASDSGTDEYFEIMALRQQYYRRMRGMSDIDDTVVQGPAALDRTEAQHNRIIRGILAWMFVAIVVVAWAWYCLVGSETPQDRHWVQPRNEVGR